MFVCLVDKDDSAYNAVNSCKMLCLFYFSDYVAFIVFTKLELVIVCFFCLANIMKIVICLV
ncbi:hypothetical protein Hdeb2414_s0018g00536911 [Helianthus debilis subsp. tardiflorus]